MVPTLLTLLRYSFDPNTSAFTKECDIPNLGIHPNSIGIDDNIHILHGGVSNDEYLVFDINTKELQKYQDPLTVDAERRGASLLEYNGKLIRFGGDSKKYNNGELWMSSSIQSDDHGSIEWTEMKQWKLPKQLFRCGSVLFKHYIFVFGGKDRTGSHNGSFLDTIHALNLKRDDGWKELGVKCPDDNQFTACLIAGDVHIYGMASRKHYVIPIQTLMLSIGVEDVEIVEEIKEEDIVDDGFKSDDKMKGNDDMKCTECDELRQLLSSKMMENETLKEDRDRLMIEHQEKVNLYESRIMSLEQELSASKAIVERLKKENESLNEECKENKLALNEMKSELEAMKRKQKMDVSKWREWDSDEVVDWICSIEDGKYKKYEEGLRSAFREEEVNGSHLTAIGKSELRDWGIKSFSDRLGMEKHIQQLVAQQSESLSVVAAAVDVPFENEGTKGTQYIPF